MDNNNVNTKNNNNNMITNTNNNSSDTTNHNNNNKQIKFIQINLHHAKGATAVLHKRFNESKLDVALIQEPWTVNNKVLGIPTSTHKLIYDENQVAPRTAILVSNRVYQTRYCRSFDGGTHISWGNGSVCRIRLLSWRYGRNSST